ncbi:MAG TPA: TonB-dependent receptor, partial [Gemmatimonadales bacterium]|nr:TonB-dependent receptor [Gemmatimonadales bacterium]
LASDRDYRSLMEVLPQVTSSGRGDPLNVGGSTGLENQYFIDGENVTSPFNAASGVALPYNFVREVQVAEGGYEARYGKALGAVVNAVTYSGTDDFELSGFAFVTPGGLSATPKALPALEQSGDVDFDVGVRVGGPIRRGRLYYSAAYNPRVERFGATIPGIGNYVDRNVSHRFAGKLSWRSPRGGSSLDLSFLGDPTIQHQVAVPGGAPGTPGSPDPFLSRQINGSLAGILRGRFPAGGGLVLDGQIARLSGHLDNTPLLRPVAADPLFLDYVNDTVSGGYGYDLRRHVGRTTVAVNATWTGARHTVMLGGAYEDNATTDIVTNNVIFYTGVYSWAHSHLAGTVHNRVPELYLQDEWRLTPRFTLSPGLRWSSQYFIGASGHIAQRIVNEWQPRVGVTWTLGSSGRERIFASYGRFYQQLPTYFAVAYYIGSSNKWYDYNSDPRVPGASPYDSTDYSGRESDYANTVRGVKAENHDEYTLGYERIIGSTTRLRVRGIQRHLRSSLGVGILYDGTQVLGTPGQGNLAFLPAPRREYWGLELSLGGSWRRLRYGVSYVLSRTRGNYPGLYDADYGGTAFSPNVSGALNPPYTAINSYGLLPNDRTHVVKLTAVDETGIGVTAGVFLTIASGTPLSDRGADANAPGWATFAPRFLTARGSAGRTPTLWDLNLRLSYLLPAAGHPRVLLDLLHVGNPQRPLWLNDQHYFGVDAAGAQSSPNPHYLEPLAYQPPMAVRLGMEWGI